MENNTKKDIKHVSIYYLMSKCIEKPNKDIDNFMTKFITELLSDRKNGYIFSSMPPKHFVSRLLSFVEMENISESDNNDVSEFVNRLIQLIYTYNMKDETAFDYIGLGFCTVKINDGQPYYVYTEMIMYFYSDDIVCKDDYKNMYSLLSSRFLFNIADTARINKLNRYPEYVSIIENLIKIITERMIDKGDFEITIERGDHENLTAMDICGKIIGTIYRR